MRTLVTGAAGFIGSNLVDALLAGGVDVLGIDCFAPYYAESVKRANLEPALANPGFEFVDGDLRTARLEPLLEGVSDVYHLAAQPGVRDSWGTGFASYVENNIIATQRLLEACRGTTVRRFVYASSSSVYGSPAREDARESDPPAPHSPYGVTKLAGEHLCDAYSRNWGVPAVSLRYFTVYGPRQRPDMGVHRMIQAAHDGTPFPLYGDGNQVRDFTFVDDIVSATIAAAESHDAPATPLNVAGGSRARLLDVVGLVEEVVGRRVGLERLGAAPGDVGRTGGNTESTRRILGWTPRTQLREGIIRQAAWQTGSARRR